MQKSVSANYARAREEEGRGRELRNYIRVSRNGIVTMNRKPREEDIPRQTVARLNGFKQSAIYHN